MSFYYLEIHLSPPPPLLGPQSAQIPPLGPQSAGIPPLGPHMVSDHPAPCHNPTRSADRLHWSCTAGVRVKDIMFLWFIFKWTGNVSVICMVFQKWSIINFYWLFLKNGVHLKPSLISWTSLNKKWVSSGIRSSQYKLQCIPCFTINLIFSIFRRIFPWKTIF